MNVYIVTLDPGGDSVPPRKDWRPIEADDPRGACMIYAIEHIHDFGTFRLLAASEKWYTLHGWAGLPVSVFEVIRHDETVPFHIP